MATVEVDNKLATFPDVVSEDPMDYSWSLDPRVGYLNITRSSHCSLDPRIVYLACDGDRIVGYASCYHTTKRAIEAELQSIYILNKYQRIGIGTNLVTRVDRWLLEHGKNSLLEGYDGNISYVRLYQILGGDLADGPYIGRDLQRLSKSLDR